MTLNFTIWCWAHSWHRPNSSHGGISQWVITLHSAWNVPENVSPAGDNPGSYCHDFSAFPWLFLWWHLTPTILLLVKAKTEKDRIGWWLKIANPVESHKSICWKSGNQISLVPGKKNHTKKLVGGVHGTKKGSPWVSASGRATCSIIWLVFSSTPTSWKIKTHTPPPWGGKNLQASTPHLHSASQPLPQLNLHFAFSSRAVEVQWWETSSRPFPVTTSSRLEIALLWSGRQSFA